jgi:hypothetical protein
MAKDLNFIYKSTTINFDKLNKPTEPTAKPVKGPNGINKGQLEVAISTEAKFSNIRFNTEDLISYLNEKYGSEYFVFINELDILTVPDSYDLATDSYQREVSVHYTIVDKNSKLVVAGLATSRISSKENDPKKIVNTAFGPIARTIATRFKAVLSPAKPK